MNGSQASLSNSESLSSSHTSLTNNSQSNSRINMEQANNSVPEQVSVNMSVECETVNDVVRANEGARPECSERDITTAVVDRKGAVLVNQYWGVSLEIPENALPEGVEQEIFFVITDPRLCENTPPLDFENGTGC